MGTGGAAVPQYYTRAAPAMDITIMAYVLSYVRYINNNDIHEDLPLCQPLHGRTTEGGYFSES